MKNWQFATVLYFISVLFDPSSCTWTGNYICANRTQKLWESPCGSETLVIFNSTLMRDSSVREVLSCDGKGCPYDNWIQFEHGEWGCRNYFQDCPDKKDRDYLPPNPQDFIFPIQDGFQSNQQNFGSPRVRDGFRGVCHPATDMYTDADNFKGTIVAMIGGVVTQSRNFSACDSGPSPTAPTGVSENSYMISIYNSTINLTFHYCELNFGRKYPKVGQTIVPGQYLGIATKCRMLHFIIDRGLVDSGSVGQKLPYRGENMSGWFQFDYLGRGDVEIPHISSRQCYEDPILYNVLDDVGALLNNPNWFLDEVYFTTRTNCSEECYSTGICVKNQCKGFPPEPVPITIIEASETWRYFKGTESPGTEWNLYSFDDSSWLEGKTGIGYADGDDTTVLSDMQNNYVSFYLRKQFKIPIPPSKVLDVHLAVDYDDGFVAFLNGVEVARRNVDQGQSYSTPASRQREAGTPEDFFLLKFTHLLLPDNNILGIEVHNQRLSSSDCSMIPKLTLIVDTLPEETIGSVVESPAVPVSSSTTLLLFSLVSGCILGIRGFWVTVLNLLLCLSLGQSQQTTAFPPVLELGLLDGIDGFKMTGPPGGQSNVVSGAGDFNSDQIDDLLIGAPRSGFGEKWKAGHTFVVFGSRNFSNIPIELGSLNGRDGFSFVGAERYAGTGKCVQGVGDVNGDSVDDIMVSGVGNSGGYAVKTTYVIFGGANFSFRDPVELSSLNGVTGFKIVGDPDHYSGYSIGGRADFNNDGIGDLIIGSYTASPNGRYSGSAHVIFGKQGTRASDTFVLSSLGNNSDFSGIAIHGESEWNFFGAAVDGIGDFNDDGIDDIILGAWGANSKQGVTYVLFGSTELPSILHLSNMTEGEGIRIIGEAMFDASGVSVRRAGDINGDGIADIVLGAEWASPNGILRAGSCYVVFGSNSLSNFFELTQLNGGNGFKINGEVPHGGLGTSVDSVSDVNGDGIDDIILGAPGASASYVIFGKKDVPFVSPLDVTTLDGTNGFKIQGEAMGDEAGWTVSGCGDVNGDGSDDIAIGAYWKDFNTGACYVVFGKKEPTPSAPNNLPLIKNPIPDLQGLVGAPFEFIVPPDTFNFPHELTFSALMIDGTPLPSWLHFVAEERRFYGQPLPGDEGGIQVRLFAQYGEISTSEIFQLVIQPQSDDPEDHIPFGVRLTNSGDMATTMSIVWATEYSDLVDSYVRYSTEESSGELKGNVLTQYCFPEDGIIDTYEGHSAYIHWALLRGLIPNTRYYYTVTSDNNTRELMNFSTIESYPDAVKFMVYGDTQLSGPVDGVNRVRVRDKFKALMQHHQDEFDFMFLLGDISSQPGGAKHKNWQEYWDIVFHDVEAGGAFKPTFFIEGNHDMATAYDVGAHHIPESRTLMYQNLPGAPGKEDVKERYYSFKVGSFAFLIGNSNKYNEIDYPEGVGYPDGNFQNDWLKEVLLRYSQEASATSHFCHIPLFSSPSYFPETYHDTWDSLFSQYNLTLQFNGHTHAYSFDRYNALQGQNPCFNPVSPLFLNPDRIAEIPSGYFLIRMEIVAQDVVIRIRYFNMEEESSYIPSVTVDQTVVLEKKAVTEVYSDPTTESQTIPCEEGSRECRCLNATGCGTGLTCQDELCIPLEMASSASQLLSFTVRILFSILIVLFVIN